MKRLIAIVLAGAACLTIAGCAEVIDAGNKGVSVNQGVVDPQVYEGFVWYNPFTTSIYEIDARTRVYSDEVAVTTKDLQIVTIKFNQGWSPSANSIPALYKKYGEKYGELLVPPATLSILKRVLGGYRAPELVANQQRIQSVVAELVRNRMRPVGISTETFDILSITFSKDYAGAIEAKEVAVQRAAAAVNETAVVVEEGKQKVIAAKAEGEALQLKSAAIVANPKLVAFEWVKKWDGAMPATVYCTSSTPCVQGGE